MDKLDHFIKETLGFYRYVRYVDDFIILDEDREKLEETIAKVNMFLFEELKLKLSPKKVFLKQASEGVDFLGYYIKPTHTLVRRRVVRRFKNKMHKMKKDENGFLPVSSISMINSYMGHFIHANSYNLREKFLK